MIIEFLIGGLIFLILEGIIPGIGIFGVLGIISLLVALFLMLGGDMQALMIIFIILIFAVVIIGSLAVFFPQSKIWKTLTLHLRSTTEKGYTGVETRKDLLNAEGFALTVLRPAGTAIFNGQHVDVVTENAFVEEGTKVVVISVSGARIVVRPIES